MSEDTSSWNRGEDTILRYSLNRNDRRISIESRLGYLTLFNEGGPIGPLNYISPTFCAFKWGFPILDFKVLNNRPDTLFLTEVVFDIEESRADSAPLLAIKKDTHQNHAGTLLLANEGWCDLTDLTISFHLVPGSVTSLANEAPYPHSITVPLLEDRAEIDVTEEFREEGVDIDGLILLINGQWDDQDIFVAPSSDGLEERMTGSEMQERWKKCLGRFSEEIGTLIGEINFTSADESDRKIKFHAPVYLSNVGRKGIPKPSTFTYDTAFEIQNINYLRSVPISHTLQPGEADRFTVRVAVPQSSFHRFHATVRDISGLALRSLPIEMSCFVPRSRRAFVQQLIARISSG